jgi:hypothetical protein
VPAGSRTSPFDSRRDSRWPRRRYAYAGADYD